MSEGARKSHPAALATLLDLTTAMAVSGFSIRRLAGQFDETGTTTMGRNVQGHAWVN